MDAAKLAELKAKWADVEEPLQLGRFNPDLIPELTFQTFEGDISIEAAVSPDCGFRLLRSAIRAADETLDVYIYNISAEHIIEEIEAKVDAELTVRLMYDPHDSGQKEFERLSQIDGLDFQTAPTYRNRSAFTVCHQKVIVADNKEVFLGSANFAGTSFPNVTEPGVYKKGNREWIVRIKNAGVARWFADLFQADWDIEPLEGPSHLFEAPQVLLEPGVAPAGLVNVPDEVFDIHAGTASKIIPVVSPDNYFTEVLREINESQSSIDIQQQNIKAAFDEDAKLDLLLQAVKARKDAGVEVRILVSPKYSWEASLDSMDAYDLGGCIKAINLKYFTHLHNKGIIFDRKRVLVTSTNWTMNSITKAREAGVLITSDSIAEYYAKTFDLDWNAALDRNAVPQHLLQIQQQLANEPESVVQLDSVPVP